MPALFDFEARPQSVQVAGTVLSVPEIVEVSESVGFPLLEGIQRKPERIRHELFFFRFPFIVAFHLIKPVVLLLLLLCASLLFFSVSSFLDTQSLLADCPHLLEASAKPLRANEAKGRTKEKETKNEKRQRKGSTTRQRVEVVYSS